MSAAIEDARKTPPVLAGLLSLIIVLLLVSIGLQAGVINPTAQSTQSEVRQIACAIAEQTANASRVRTEDPKTGELESRRHFLTRMLAQRHTLLIARGTGCDSAPGFPPFEVQVARALQEINGLLGYRRRPSEVAGVGLTPTASSGGDAPTGQTGTLLPGPREGGSNGDVGDGKRRGGGEGGSGGHGKPPAPSPSPAPVPSESTSPSSPGRSGDAPGNPEPPASPSTGTVPSTLEATGGAVKEVGEGAGKAVEGVGKGVECALRGGC